MTVWPEATGIEAAALRENQMVTAPRIALSDSIDRYDPLEAPDPQQWLALDESERIDLAERYHRDAGIRVPDHTAHAMIHAVVESQIALGDELPVERTLRRLMAEGTRPA